METPDKLPLADLSATKRALLKKWMRQAWAVPKAATIVDSRPLLEAPLSYSQLRLWFLQQMAPGSPSYNVPLAIRLGGDLRIDILREALAAVVQRHSVLRVQIENRAPEPLQRVIENPDLALPVVDLSASQERIQKFLNAESQRPFDLANAPPFRWKLVRAGPNDWLLLVVFHHIVADGRSIAIFYEETATLYNALCGGRPNPLSQIPIQYLNFASWQRQVVTKESLAIQLGQLKERLLDAPSTLELPGQHGRPAIQRFCGNTIDIPIAPSIASGLKAFARSTNATLFIVLLATFKVLLFRYSGQYDLCVGSPVANRHPAEVEGLIGLFANTIVVRTRLRDGMTFYELLEHVKSQVLEALEFQQVPFEQLIEVLEIRRDTSRNPLVQILFNVQSSTHRVKEMNGLAVTPIPVQTGSSKFDLSVSVSDTPERSIASIEYNSDIFDHSAVERMGRHWMTLIDSLLQHPHQRIDSSIMLKDSERRAIVVACSQTEREYPGIGSTLHEMVEEQVRRTPEAVAVIFGDQSLTYRELDQKANHLAARLGRSGVRTESRVGACLDRSLCTPVALLAVLKAGAAFIPFNPEDPGDRHNCMIEASGLTHLIVDQPSRFAEWTERIRIINPDSEEIAVESARIDVNSDNLAYILFTSGSTGAPKGVMIPHRGIRNRLAWMQEKYLLTSADRVLQKTPCTFDVSVWELFWPLISGATLVMAPPGWHLEAGKLASQIVSAGITVLHFVPSMLKVFLEEPAAALCGTLRLVISSGEALTSAVVDLFHSILPGELWNLYGPTEASIDVSAYCCMRNGPASVPIGRPIANTELYVLDSALNPVPQGVTGQLFIGGAGLARGYASLPAQTAEHFIPDPHSQTPGLRLYATGDLGRVLEDGNIQFVGRADDQVKIHGVRVELAEIESALLKSSLVAEAAVDIRAAKDGGKELIAYFVPKTAEASSEVSSWIEELERERIAEWRQVFGMTYSASSRPPSRFDIAGWDSSYTSNALSEEEMMEWSSQTVSRILSRSPERILEVGCGTGLLLFRLASKCREYWGTDASPHVIARLSSIVSESPAEFSHVKLFTQSAHDFSGLPRDHFDLVVLNSVVQYFPSAEYLKRVCLGLSNVLSRTGAIFIGDIRNLQLADVFQCSVLLDRASESTSAAELKQQLEIAIAREHELLVDPYFFVELARDLPARQGVEIQLKAGRFPNEMTRYRYDVVLAPPHGSSHQPLRLSWHESGLSLERLGSLLAEPISSPILITGIPNARIVRDVHAHRILTESPDSRSLAEIREAVSEADVEASDPQSFYDLGEKLNRGVELRWSFERHDNFDAIFYPHSGFQPIPLETYRQVGALYSNDLLREPLGKRIASRLRDHLAAVLPASMIPRVFVCIDSIPKQSSGKVNRKALPLPQELSVSTVAYIAPRSETEALISEVWRDVLHLDRVGIKDNFFEIGGDSIQAIQIVSKLNAAGVRVAPKHLFLHQTVEELAANLDTLDVGGSEIEPDQPPSSRFATLTSAQLACLPTVDLEEAFDLTPLQEQMLRARLRFAIPGLHVTHLSFLASGDIDPEILERAWDHVIDSFPSLRTSFVIGCPDAPFQAVWSHARREFEYHDWRDLSTKQFADRLRNRIFEIREEGFPLNEAPQSHRALFRESERQSRFVWFFSYMLQDGWSLSGIWREFITTFEALRTGRKLPPTCRREPFRSFVIWSRNRHIPSRLPPFPFPPLERAPRPSILADRCPSAAVEQDAYEWQSHTLTLAASTAASTFAKQYRLTLFTVLAGAWAILLSRILEQDEVVFGVWLSGRNAVPQNLRDVTGMCCSLVPAVVTLGGQTVIEWLNSLQSVLTGLQRCEHISNDKIAAWLERPISSLEFDTYIVFENFPIDPHQGERPQSLGFVGVDSLAQTEHTLRIEFFPGPVVGIRMFYYSQRLPAEDVRAWVHAFRRILDDLVSKPDAPLSSIRQAVQKVRQEKEHNL